MAPVNSDTYTGTDRGQHTGNMAPKRLIIVDDDGVVAFGGLGNNEFPKRVSYYRGSMYIVPDWNVNHDHGDEDDGEAKVVSAAVNGTLYNNSPVIVKGLK